MRCLLPAARPQASRGAAAPTAPSGASVRRRRLACTLFLPALLSPALLSCSPGGTPPATPSVTAADSKDPSLRLSANGCTFTVSEFLTKVTTIRDGEHTYTIGQDPRGGFSHWMVLSGAVSCSEHGWVDAQRFSWLVLHPSGEPQTASPASPVPAKDMLRWVEVSGLSQPFGTGQEASGSLRFGPVDAVPFWQAFPLREDDEIALLKTDWKGIEYAPRYRRPTNPLGKTWSTPPGGAWTTPRRSS